MTEFDNYAILQAGIKRFEKHYPEEYRDLLFCIGVEAMAARLEAERSSQNPSPVTKVRL